MLASTKAINKKRMKWLMAMCIVMIPEIIIEFILLIIFYKS